MHFSNRRLVAGLALVTAGACSDRAYLSKSVSDTATAAAAAPPSMAIDRVATTAAMVEAAAQTPVPAPARKLIRTAEMRIQLGNVETGVREADSVARVHGGLVADSRTSQSDRGARTAEIVIRVPADRFQAAVADLRRLGRVRSENISADDITRDYTDLEIRLSVKEETVARLRSLLLNRAGKLSDVLEVERELDRAVTELEQMKGMRRFYDQQVAMSTITATLYESTASGLVAISDPVAGAFRRALEALGASLAALVYFLIFLVPWAALAAPAYLAARSIRGRRGKQHLVSGAESSS